MKRDAKIVLGVVGGLFFLFIVLMAAIGSSSTGTADNSSQVDTSSMPETTEPVPSEMSESDYTAQVYTILGSMEGVTQDIVDVSDGLSSGSMSESEALGILTSDQSTTASNLAQLQGMTPPGKYETYHGLLIKAVENEGYSIDYMISGVENYSTSDLDQAISYMETATSYINQATDELNRVTG